MFIFVGGFRILFGEKYISGLARSQLAFLTMTNIPQFLGGIEFSLTNADN